ncbi:hypothetical protein [Streptomyces cyanogenus]|uniref:Uncharacterized protein n=1 Tax=Streptomyces cyanogenus TaxID=80860 RepID=A0ABX7TKT9_STRCY|nr:hypothetical protein [Streptomyces cyanogenus]QTD97002.1 hypothetical protein S1361_06535 [Streptomyces cyanogenus]
MPASAQTASEHVHRYRCTIHDGDGCDSHCDVTVDQLIAQHADTVAAVIGQAPATTLADFVNQISTASCRMYDAGIVEAEFLEDAAIYLGVSTETSGDEQAGLMKKARDTLTGLAALVDEYRAIA